jgi:hypothetical protein
MHSGWKYSSKMLRHLPQFYHFPFYALYVCKNILLRVVVFLIMQTWMGHMSNYTAILKHLIHYQFISNLEQKLMCPIQFQSLLVFLDHSNDMFKNKVQKQWWLHISLFQTIMKKKFMRQIFTYTEFIISSIWKHFNYQNYFMVFLNSVRDYCIIFLY